MKRDALPMVEAEVPLPSADTVQRRGEGLGQWSYSTAPVSIRKGRKPERE